MKIGHLDTNLTNANATKLDRKVSSGEAVNGLEPSAKVELSSATGTQLEGPDAASFDQAKVDRIATAIREGRFQVDAGAIADKLITNAQELLTRGSR